MRPIAQNFFFYAAYLVTMLMLAGVTYFVWSQELMTMMKVLILLPMIYISVLLTQCLNDKFNEPGKAS